MFNSLKRPLFTSLKVQLQKCSCSSENLPTKVPKELTKASDVTSKIQASKAVKKEDLEWRTPWHETEGKYYSTLRTFYSETSNASLLKFITQPVDFSPSSVKKWWKRRKENNAIIMQSYIPERNQTLGNELAAAHFIVHRGGAVKFFGEEKWIKANELGDYELPKTYQEGKFLQAIDCTGVDLYFEGLNNFRALRQLEWFSINSCKNIDDWGLDRLSNLFKDHLLYLDLRNCPLITYRGLSALYKMEKLKILYVDNMTESNEYEMTCLMLQEIYPDLDIREY